MRKYLEILLLLIMSVPASLVAEEDHDSPVQIVTAFHEALTAGDREAALRLLDPDVVIFESGGAELSREEYASHHLGSDMEFSAATTRKIVDQNETEVEEAGWVLTRSETRGTFRDREVDILGTETILLRRGMLGWRIAHIHWSSRSKAKSH